MSQLIEHPRIGRDGRMKDTFEWVISRTPLIAVYGLRPRPRRIELLRLLHGAQQWPPQEDRDP
jgi:toxin ParE1/3/4